jgi:MarR family transcriptional regulator, lower aerobic nicotinate degradation pathway regulator
MKETGLKNQSERLYKALTEIQGPLHRDPINEHMDFTLPQLRTLMAITEHSHCSMGELGKATGYHLSALTGIIDRLIRKKLVQRIRDDIDRRVVKVALTAAGVNLTKTLYKKFIKQTSEALGTIDNQSREKLVALIEKIALNIKRI